MCVFVYMCVGSVFSFVTLKLVSTLWDPWATAINCMANADNHETGFWYTTDGGT